MASISCLASVSCCCCKTSQRLPTTSTYCWRSPLVGSAEGQLHQAALAGPLCSSRLDSCTCRLAGVAPGGHIDQHGENDWKSLRFPPLWDELRRATVHGSGIHFWKPSSLDLSPCQRDGMSANKEMPCLPGPQKCAEAMTGLGKAPLSLELKGQAKACHHEKAPGSSAASSAHMRRDSCASSMASEMSMAARPQPDTDRKNYRKPKGPKSLRDPWNPKKKMKYSEQTFTEMDNFNKNR